jgi:hypothetical protein
MLAYWVVRNSSNECEVVIDLIMYLYIAIVSRSQLLRLMRDWIGAKRRSPCQLFDDRVEVLRRAYHRQLDSVGRGHFELRVLLPYTAKEQECIMHASLKSRRQGGDHSRQWRLARLRAKVPCLLNRQSSHWDWVMIHVY